MSFVLHPPPPATHTQPNSPIAVGIPVAVNVVHISDGEPLGPRWPVGRLVSAASQQPVSDGFIASLQPLTALGLSHPHNIPDLVAVTNMEEVD